MPAYTIVHRDDAEQTGDWSLVRRSLDVSSFGINLVDIPPGGSIPEHDETDRDQEEVFFVLSGDPTVVVDGEELETPTGTFVRVDVTARRTVRNHGAEPSSVLIVSAPRSSGYEPMGWG
jgi:mannose-6-phosphate isomerase-like protein (cupin superfamily)